MKAMGSVSVPQEAFMAVINVKRDGPSEGRGKTD